MSVKPSKFQIYFAKDCMSLIFENGDVSSANILRIDFISGKLCI